MPEEILETPQPQPEAGRPLDETNWTKIIFVALVGLGLLAASAYAGYYYGTQQVQQPEKPVPIVSQPNPTPTPTPEPASTDSTANWETYANTKYKYTLKYPQTWQVTSLPGTDLTTFHEPLFSSSACDYDKTQLCINIFVLVTTFNPEANIYEGDIVIDTTRGNKVTNEVSLVLDNEDARGFEYWQEDYGEKGRLQYFVIATHKNNKYTVMYEEEKKDKEFLSASDWENREILDQILSTFKFLN